MKSALLLWMRFYGQDDHMKIFIFVFNGGFDLDIL